MSSPDLDDRQLQIELSEIEEADAWFEYLEDTKNLRGNEYEEKETWAWARLKKRLREVSVRRQRLEQ